jgi:heme-degrading monooxygenase HmoA
MAVKILIKRFVPETKENELNALLMKLRAFTTSQHGYITGETLKRIDKPGEYLVISTWLSIDDWRKWVLSKERNELQRKIDDLLGKETHYEIYSYD